MTDVQAAPVPARSEPVWANRFVSVRYEPVTRYDGLAYDTTIVTSGSGHGAVVVPCCVFRDIPYLGVISIRRPAIGNRMSLEFPRGVTADLGAKEATREMTEETGLASAYLDRLGLLHPDTGILDTEVSVWLARVAPVCDASRNWMRQGEGHVDPETGSVFQWLSEPEFMAAIAGGRVACSMTLAAFAMLQCTPHPPAAQDQGASQ